MFSLLKPEKLKHKLLNLERESSWEGGREWEMKTMKPLLNKTHPDDTGTSIQTEELKVTEVYLH